MWLFEDELESWFDRVMDDRKNKYSSGGGDEEGGAMMENELAKGRR